MMTNNNYFAKSADKEDMDFISISVRISLSSVYCLFFWLFLLLFYMPFFSLMTHIFCRRAEEKAKRINSKQKKEKS
jgi:hypothetical protein